MGFRLSTLIMTALLLSACAAFDSGDKTVTEMTSEGKPAVSPGENKYQGFYTGKAELGDNKCKTADIADDVSLDILQAGEVISLMTEDNKEASANLDGDKVSILIKKVSESRMYELSFDAEVASAVISVFESVSEGDLGEACVVAKAKLEKSDKPEGWGEKEPAVASRNIFTK